MFVGFGLCGFVGVLVPAFLTHRVPKVSHFLLFLCMHFFFLFCVEQWQRAEDPHGNPFVAMVVDPLRSFHLQKPEIKAFRAYPPEYNSLVPNECPDGSIQPVEQLRLEQWGSCWNRYYELEVEYYMSSTSRSILEQLTQDYLWMRTLCSQKEAQGEAADKQTTQRLESIQKTLQSAAVAVANTMNSGSVMAPGGVSRGFSRGAATGGAASTVGGASGGGGGGATSSGGSGGGQKKSDLSKAVQQLVDMASEELRETALQETKERVFGARK